MVGDSVAVRATARPRCCLALVRGDVGRARRSRLGLRGRPLLFGEIEVK